ncbi:hypothetical protein B2G71_13770 [Novosphingobium sp. PC22D]|nr:hypothetical protein B2G71_13770 [Novosphingobium sp. PC22D]
MYASSALFLVTFAIGHYRDTERTSQFTHLAVISIGVPLVLALLHLRIRMERAKGRNALREKCESFDSKTRRPRSPRK